jgi:hypothetical protein
MTRSYYQATIAEFIQSPLSIILGSLAEQSEFAIIDEQEGAWIVQIELLQRIPLRQVVG